MNQDLTNNIPIKNEFLRLINPKEENIAKDDLIINILRFNKTSKKKELACEGYGSWVGELFIDQTRYNLNKL